MKYKITLYSLAYLVIAFTGFNLFNYMDWTKIIIFMILLYLVAKYKVKFDVKVIYLLLYVLVIIEVQSIMWSGSIFTTLTFITTTVIFPYLILKIMGLDFPEYLVNIIYGYSIISLFFWILTNISSSFHSFLAKLPVILGTDPVKGTEFFAAIPKQFIIYTYEPAIVAGMTRNPGPYSEPGAFAVILIFALIFNILKSNNLFNKKNIVLMITIISTFSTAGILALLIIFNYYIMVTRKIHQSIKYLIFFLTFIISGYVIFNVEFLATKVFKEYSMAAKKNLNDPTTGRFFGARKALIVLNKYPLTGRGLLARTRARANTPEAAGYGFMGFAARIGIPGILLYFFYLFNSLKQYCYYYNFNPKFSAFAFLALLSILFAQAYTERMIFFMLFLSSFIYPNFGIKFKRYIELNN